METIEETFIRKEEGRISITLYPGEKFAVCAAQCPYSIHPTENFRHASQNQADGQVVLCTAIDLKGRTGSNKSKEMRIDSSSYPKCAFPQGKQIFPR